MHQEIQSSTFHITSVLTILSKTALQCIIKFYAQGICLLFNTIASKASALWLGLLGQNISLQLVVSVFGFKESHLSRGMNIMLFLKRTTAS